MKIGMSTVRRFGIGAAVGVMLTGCEPAESSEEYLVNDIPLEARDAIMSWSKCRSSYIAGRIDLDIVASELVDAALDSCVEHEQEVDRLYYEYYGSIGLGSQFRKRARVDLITIVENGRLGRAPSDPLSAWSFCIGQSLPAEISSADVDLAFDAALSACSIHEAGVRNHLAKIGGPSSAEANFQAYIDTMRRHVREEFMTVN